MSIKLTEGGYNYRDDWPTIAEMNGLELPKYTFNRINGHVISNGGMERANRDIKTIIRHAYGYTNFERLRNRIMFVKNK